MRHQVLDAARARATALANADADALTRLLHPAFRWTSHLGETYDRDEYVRRNTAGGTVWRSQDLGDPDVVVVGDTAVLFTEVTDVVAANGTGDGTSEDAGDDPAESFTMPITQVWVREAGAWVCIAGHAGPRRT